MSTPELIVVTGAMSYLGSYVAQRLLERGYRIRTLTGHPEREHPLRDRLEIVPYHFAEPHRLVEDLRGATAVVNSYWVRFPRGLVTYGAAVANTQNLIRAAREAGVERFVQISITQPQLASPLPYFRGKAILEQTLRESGLSTSILRPTVLFGREDILINNIAWLLRHLPVFGIVGRGDYRLQPTFVGDLAELAATAVASRTEQTLDAVGPETYAFADLVRLVRTAIGSRTPLVSVSAATAHGVGRLLGPLLGDVLLTRDEIAGLCADLLVSQAQPTCPTRFSRWLGEHAALLGRGYASELARHYR